MAPSGYFSLEALPTYFKSPRSSELSMLLCWVSKSPAGAVRLEVAGYNTQCGLNLSFSLVIAIWFGQKTRLPANIIDSVDYNQISFRVSSCRRSKCTQITDPFFRTTQSLMNGRNLELRPFLRPES